MIVKLSYFMLFVLLVSVILNAVYICRFTDTLYAISKEDSGESIEALSQTF